MLDGDLDLVTGGAGFIGSALVRSLIQRGRNVLVIDNLSRGKRSFLPSDSRIHFEHADIRDAEALSRILDRRRLDTVYHLAALHFIPDCNERPLEALEINVLGTRFLLDMLKARPPRKLFFASTAAVYSPASITQSVSQDPPMPNDIYGITKLAGEDAVRLFSMETGVPSAIGRINNAYGHNETNPHLIPVILEQVCAGATSLRLGNLETRRDYTHVLDVVGAIHSLTGYLTGGAVVANIGTGTSWNAREIIALLSELTGRPLSITVDPGRVRPGERFSLQADVSELQTWTGWTPTISVRDGLRALLAGGRLGAGGSGD